jgi:uncharacterized oxidoreductase
MMKLSGNTILVTGGGSGIGMALAHRLHDRGNTVIIAGRRQEALDEASQGRPAISTMTLDIADPTAIEAFAAKLIAEHPALNVLLNNAGIMDFEDLTARRDLAITEATITTNLLGPIRLTNTLIDHLAGRSDGVIVNFTSGLGFVPMIDAPTYSATKAAIHSYTVSLREQLRGKAEVIELAPPAVQTELTPGQETRPGYMPLDAFADQIMTLWQDPTPPELLVQNVHFLRNAEREGRFDETLRTLTERSRKSRG